MEPDERHDLRENDLQEFLENLGEFWNRWGNAILIVVTIALVIFAGLRLYWSQQAQAHESAWRDLASTTSPDAFVQVAATHSIPAVESIAQLWAGDLFLAEARGGAEGDHGQSQQAQEQTDQNSAQQGEGANEPAQTQDQPQRDPEQALAFAEESYQAVLAQAPEKIYRINAMQGLAAVAESRQNWASAREHYNRVIELAQSDYPTSAAQAKSRLKMLPRLKEPTPFGTEPPASQNASANRDMFDWPWTLR